jgi:large subunit ribosomal protein L3
MSNVNRTVKGLLGKKLGMTQVWDANNKMIPVTVVEAGSNVVTQIKSLETDGYTAVQVAYGAIEPRKVNKPEAGHFAKASVAPRRYVAEIRTNDASEYSVGQEIGVEVFEVGAMLDVVGTGHMKRHGFHGVGASHGQHRNHRKPGSIGATSTPGRVFKGTRMAGRMGSDRVTAMNLQLHSVDLEKGLLLIKGAVPGPKGQLVFVRNAVKGA